MQFFTKFWGSNSKNTAFDQMLKEVLGYLPKNKLLYQKAFTHRSLNIKNKEGFPVNFERLEFLGDSVIDLVVANYLYGTLVHDNEGQLTRMKSKIVSREKLNSIGRELDLFTHLSCSGNRVNFGEDIHGNLLESLIGAVFVDKGYEKCKKIVFKIIIDPFINLEKVKQEIISHKSVLIEWGQKEKKLITFRTEKEQSKAPKIIFRCILLVADKELLKVRESSKKKAEEKAAKRAVRILKIK